MSSSRVAELAYALSRHELEAQPPMTLVLDELRAVLHVGEVGLYCPTVTEAGWDLERFEWRGGNPVTARAGYAAFLSGVERDVRHFGCYDPYAVEPVQRNVALSTGDLKRLGFFDEQRHERSLNAVGHLGHHQLRALVCHGPRLLGWVGGFRAEPFTPADVASLQRLAEPLQRRLMLERIVGAGALHLAALEGVLAVLEEPAFIVSQHGRFELANDAGLALLAADGACAVFAAIETALLGGGRDVLVTRLDARGARGYVLAICTAQSEGRARDFARITASWSLTARQAQVLEHLLDGKSNKEIASALKCAEVTVENHITHLFRRSGARSRTELMARVQRSSTHRRALAGT